MAIEIHQSLTFTGEVNVSQLSDTMLQIKQKTHLFVDLRRMLHRTLAVLGNVILEFRFCLFQFGTWSRIGQILGHLVV